VRIRQLQRGREVVGKRQMRSIGAEVHRRQNGTRLLAKTGQQEVAVFPAPLQQPPECRYTTCVDERK